MEKFINTIDVFPIIETRRQELGITLEEIGHHLGYTKSGVRKLLRDNRIRVDTLEHLSVILKQDFFRSISDQLRKGKYIPHTEKLMEKNPNFGIEKTFMTSAEIVEALEGIFTFTVYEIAELMNEHGYKFELDSSSGQYKWVVFKA